LRKETKRDVRQATVTRFKGDRCFGASIGFIESKASYVASMKESIVELAADATGFFRSRGGRANRDVHRRMTVTIHT
jgi:hypothetical protein